VSVIDYNSEFRVLVSVKGHPYPRDAFFDMLESFEGLAFTAVEQPASQLFLSTEYASDYEAILLYDMPGIDFSSQPPKLVPPPASLKSGLPALLEQGKGLVFLHHAIAGWPLWPEYGEIVGGRFLYRPAKVRGVARPDSGYRHAVTHNIRVVTDHPVVAGVDSAFELTDELYLYQVFNDSVIPLLRSDYAFDRDHFYSAELAVTGHLYSNEGWQHGAGSNLLGWVKSYRNSPIVYLQSGDNAAVYQNPNFRRLLDNALRWVGSAEAHAWARKVNGGAR
jgi:type 1 glutamine amidotransferase